MVDLYTDFSFEQNDWDLFSATKDVAPLQRNSDDCGVFVLMYTYCLTFNVPLQSIHSDDTGCYRKKIMLTITSGMSSSNTHVKVESFNRYQF